MLYLKVCLHMNVTDGRKEVGVPHTPSYQKDITSRFALKNKNVHFKAEMGSFAISKKYYLIELHRNMDEQVQCN